MFHRTQRALVRGVTLALIAAALRAPAASAQVSTVDLRAAAALVARVVPGHAKGFRLSAIPDSAGLDVFEVAQDGRQVVLRGSSGVAIASALNWYLEHVAGVNVSLPFQPIRLGTLPPVPAPVRIRTPYRIRYFFNYCTFSYSMAWWGWSDWQRMIDWMALKGINTPLAVTGQEAVWRATLLDLGFTRRQVADFLVGPAYLPWGWMGNIDGLGGPLPDSWIDGHIALERRILARERSLGMRPVLQGFTGHVPASITKVFPAARIHQTGDWSAGFSGTWFLDPLDPLFQRIGRRFIERQTELYGTDHLYAADPFNEIDPPSNDSTFLAGMGHAIYSSMASADPQATWLLQGWFLYYQARFWQDPQAEAFLGAVPDDRMVVLDLWGDRHPVWQARRAFYGKPWVWNVLYNFGGKLSVNGDLPSIARNLDSALRSPAHGRLAGLGMMMEGLGTNPIVPDFVLDQAWRDSVPDIEGWTHAYITRRYGADDAAAWHAWQVLLATAFRSSAQTGNFLAERPQFYKAGTAYRSEPVAPYDVHLLARALDSLLAAAPALGQNDNYRYDVVNLTRQVLGQLAIPFVTEVQEAYARKDRAALTAAESRITTLLGDLDTLVATRQEFLLGRWTADARRWGHTPAERRLYEWNARNIITLWGTKCTEGQNDDLNLYAFKEWAGMFSSYFLPRWREFFARLDRSLVTGVPFDRAPFAVDMCTWEQRWSRAETAFPTEPRGDAVATARRLWDKYRGDLR
ncbi:MAG TPA: alpha-N-acetylglucosaminidase [Gemmatimonadales bacterium]|nr:alpha-N-acetylglucosaminidase [Gemmatimonadales bacterium]